MDKGQKERKSTTKMTRKYYRKRTTKKNSYWTTKEKQGQQKNKMNNQSNRFCTHPEANFKLEKKNINMKIAKKSRPAYALMKEVTNYS